MSHAEAAKSETPKLPEIDKEDLKAVRGFVVGKLLGRTAVLGSVSVRIFRTFFLAAITALRPLPVRC